VLSEQPVHLFIVHCALL